MIKQVIVIRKDLKMRRGKEIAQVCHSSIKFLQDKVVRYIQGESDLGITLVELEWMANHNPKIVVQVHSEQELLDIYSHAIRECIQVALIKDLGLTEFKEPTYTCLAIGPDEAHLIDKITGHLPLY